MANNINIGANAVVAHTAASFATAGVTSDNTDIIYEVGNPNKSYVPGRGINGVTAFSVNKGYYFVAKLAMDLTAYLVPPVTGGSAPPYTIINSEAQAYFTRLATAGYSSNDTEKQAYDTFVTSAKSSGYYSKLKALYPFLGNSDATRLFNPISTSYNGTKQGGLTLNSTGAIFNGTNSYFTTGLSPATVLAANNSSFGAWFASPGQGGHTMGSQDSATSIMTLVPRYTDDHLYSNHYNATVGQNIDVTPVTSASGMVVSSRTSSSALALYKNGSSQMTQSAAAGTIPATPFYFGAINDITDGPIEFSNQTMKMCFIGLGISSGEATAFYTHMNSFLTAISR